MNRDHPYTLPLRQVGKQLQYLNIKIESEFKEALQSFAKAESEKYGVKISAATTLKDLLTRDTPEIREKRTELRQHYRKIKEKSRAELPQPPQINEDA